LDLQQTIAEYGDFAYVVIWVWTFFEGETFVIFAGLAARLGYLNWWLVFLCAWFGSFFGDQLYFWIGRRYGHGLLHRIPRWRHGVDQALAFLRRYNTVFILTFRFIYGVRQFSSFAIGMAGVHPLRFMALNFVAAFIWALSYSGFGFLFGHALEAILGNVVTAFGLTMLAIFLIPVGMILLAHRRHRRELRLETSEARIATSEVPVPVPVPVIATSREDGRIGN
jgi:membrane protein DedA with SNARE-associated domain